jgi:hypothetical protein
MRAHTRSAYISSSVSLLNIGASLHSPTHPPPNPPNPTLRFTTLNHRNSPFAIVLCIAVSLTGASRSNRLIGISARRLHCRMRRSLLDACCEGRRSGGAARGKVEGPGSMAIFQQLRLRSLATTSRNSDPG